MDEGASMYAKPELLWRKTSFFLKEFGEIFVGLEIKLIGYFLHRPAGIGKQFFGPVDPQLKLVLTGRDTRFRFEEFPELAITHVQFPGYFHWSNVHFNI